tara:strand:+ start:14836 stop:15030 length:195 start_codon:yes stop_codon:yes gene_type:complete
MRADEFINEDASAGGTSSGSIATVTAPMGMISRNSGNFFSGKYTADATPNTPKYMKKGKPRRAK